MQRLETNLAIQFCLFCFLFWFFIGFFWIAFDIKKEKIEAKLARSIFSCKKNKNAVQFEAKH